jgi:EAL domain-containing protein (putative c-di-GMP-specific phosphodiesterase class I)
MFEIHEYGIPASLQDFQIWIERLRPLGCRFGVDHFGRSFAAPTHLRDLAVDYVKVDGSYTRGLATNRSNQVALQGLAAMARQANVEIFGEAVENEAEWHMLRLLGFTGAQGRFLAEPRALVAGGAANFNCETA